MGLKIVVFNFMCVMIMKKMWVEYVFIVEMCVVGEVIFDLMEFFVGFGCVKKFDCIFEKGFGMIVYYVVCYFCV